MLLWAAARMSKVGRSSFGKHGSEHTDKELFPATTVFLLWTYPWLLSVPVSWAGSHPSLCQWPCHHRQFWASARLFHL